MKTKKKIIIGVLLTPVIVIFAYIVFLYFYMISETVTKGSAYGFSIGQSKEAAITRAQEQYKSKNVLFGHYDLRKKGKNWKFQKSVSQTDLNEVSLFDTWKFEFDSGFNDYVKLTFKEGRIIEIKRLRYIELP